MIFYFSHNNPTSRMCHINNESNTLIALSFNQLNLFKYLPIDHNPRAYKIHQMHLSILNKIVDLNSNCQNRILITHLSKIEINNIN